MTAANILQAAASAPNTTALRAAFCDAAVTRDLVQLVESQGYKLRSSWAWSNHHNRLGVLHIDLGPERLASTAWNVGSQRMPPAAYRTGSQHHAAVLEALQIIESHARSHGIEIFDAVVQSDGSVPAVVQ